MVIVMVMVIDDGDPLVLGSARVNYWTSYTGYSHHFTGSYESSFMYGLILHNDYNSM
jgi:hypothetical protein